MNDSTAPLRTRVNPEQNPSRGRRRASRFYLAREPFIVTLLATSALVLFLMVSALSHAFHREQQLLGERWFSRGVAELADSRYDRAESDFRTALLHAPENDSYQLNLAEALIGEGRNAQARAYLLSLWDREPENGMVNLQMARVAVQEHNREEALRYYHNAIYSTWPDTLPEAREQQRRDARLELIHYLLSIGAKPQAQSELIVLAANPAANPSEHMRLGPLFLQADDYEHALAEFRADLEQGSAQPAALAGAGTAAFELRRYADAQHYLRAAVSANPGDAKSASLLKTTELVLGLDPFGRNVPLGKRNRIVVEDFDTAGERLQSCFGPGNAKQALPSQAQSALASRFEELQSEITERGLQHDPDLIQRAMDLVFDIERQSSIACGAPAGSDLALLLIAKLHEGK